MTTTNSVLDIGEVVQASGLPVSTLHFWERHGLISPTERRGLRRQYDPEILDRIAVIVLFQQGGFTLAEIAGLLSPGAFEQGKGQLAEKLDRLRHQRSQLEAAISGLEHALACPESSPLECDDFRSMADAALPAGRHPTQRTSK